MNMYRESSDERLHALARRAGVERSLYLGEALGNALLIAAGGLAALGASLRRTLLHTRRTGSKHPA